MPKAHIQQGEREAGGCTRCGGLLVEEYCMDLSNSEHATAAQRCVQCGELVDPVILANRTRRSGTPSSKTNRISPPSSHCTEDTMTTRGAVHFSLLMLLVFAAGCAATFSQPPSEQSMAQEFVTQDQARQMAYSYRRQAQDLRDLARRLETEALLYSGQSSTDSKQANMLEVKNVLAAADDADELAREYRRQVPHGQLQ